MSLTDEAQGSGPDDYLPRFAALALRCVRREYPNLIAHVMSDASQVGSPRQLHPAFYGCYDWHSSVHGHWLLVRLMRAGAGGALPEADIRGALAENLTAANLSAEDEYLRDPGRPSFERPYGWAWLLKLHEELYLWDDPDARRWFDALRPLAATVVGKYLSFFPKQTYPVRVGTHFNTAFGLAFAWDYAEALARAGEERLDAGALEALGRLRSLVAERALTYFAGDRDAPAGWEPSGDDFLSPSLVEADLMRRVLGAEEFPRWFDKFLPGLAEGRHANLLAPADVADRSDPKIVHLDGLNLSRAWCMRSIAAALAGDSPPRGVLERAAERHAEATLPHVTGGDYAGEHWLATFAVYMLSTPRPL